MKIVLLSDNGIIVDNRCCQSCQDLCYCCSQSSKKDCHTYLLLVCTGFTHSFGKSKLKTSFQPQSNLFLLLTLCSSQYRAGKELPSASISNKIYREYSRESRVICLGSSTLNIGKEINVVSKPTSTVCNQLLGQK